MNKADYWKNICEMQEKQTKKGMNKYGQMLEENDTLTIIERITYLQEELIDGLMYCEHIKSMLSEKTCSRCGTKYGPEYKFCLNCGYEEV